MNMLIIATVTNILFHPYWETGNYTSNSVAGLMSGQEQSLIWNEARVARVGTNSTTRKWLTPKYSWDMTNRVHWMRAHTTTNAPAFHIKAGSQYGWLSLEWSASLTEPSWFSLNHNHKQYPYVLEEVVEAATNGVRLFTHTAPTFKVYMHPESDVTKRMLEAKSGFFRQRTRWNNQIYWVDMTGFFPEPEIPPTPLRAAGTPPPIPTGRD